MSHSEHVIIGVDPHKLSATIEVVDQHEQLLGSGRFTTDRAGYTAMRSYAKTWPGPRMATGPVRVCWSRRWVLLKPGHLVGHRSYGGRESLPREAPPARLPRAALSTRP
jgi:hypothetical protein